jgi:hypothetical protein
MKRMNKVMPQINVCAVSPDSSNVNTLWMHELTASSYTFETKSQVPEHLLIICVSLSRLRWAAHL